MTYNPAIIALKLNQLKAEKHYRTEEIAKRADVSFSTVQKILTGENENPTVKTMAALAKVFGVNVLYFLEI